MQEAPVSTVTVHRQAASIAAPHARVSTPDDLDALYALACSGGSGLTNLPPDRGALAMKLAASARALTDPAAREAGAAILLIIEQAGEIAGTSCIFPRVGAEWPFYSYRLTRQANRSRAVNRLKAQTLLNLANDFDGEAEVGGLFINPAFRGAALGALAARARYLFIAQHRAWFRRRVIAELRGYQDADGRSPVWDAIGRHFYDMEFHEADRTGAVQGNQFIADLGPRYPLYVSLLPPAAQAALGRPHDDGRPALEMLLAEGFADGDYVDIFDGGPTLHADIDQLRTVRDARALTVAAILAGGTPHLVATGTGASFRVARGAVTPATTADAAIDPALADTLALAPGDPILAVPA
ncbi:arginine N-succinyltransferase [Sandaracinobacteroides saxicola]|uniref:arginine N-succinyltransferase n=1 Tax=Sandaracinobacteroides saxicola TaxID=2759707 RepID=UPI001FB15E34|nr:arginine N-succinyltransferase [Sandaracinobacteroides saxicola]